MNIFDLFYLIKYISLTEHVAGFAGCVNFHIRNAFETGVKMDKTAVRKGRETAAMDSSPRAGRRCNFRKCAVNTFLILCFVACISIADAGTHRARESRKLFGGYRITPSYCKATRASRYNRGSTICMFNHECVQRGGEVVGACMDGFLFGACCQLKEENQLHIPKGPGIVMTSYLDYPEPEAEDDVDDGDQLAHWHNSFKPVIKPGYRPTEKYDTLSTGFTNEVRTTNQDLPSSPSPSSTESINSDFNEGLSQITNSLLSSPPKDSNIVYIRPGAQEKPAIYSHSTISHEGADTILLHRNGSEVDDISRPSDFNIQISSMQTKPTPSPNMMSTTTSTTPKTVSTHRPVYHKPVFKPKPGYNKNKPTLVTKGPPVKLSIKPVSTTEKYVQVATITKDADTTSENYHSSYIDNIFQKTNDSTPSMDKIENTTQSIPVTFFDAAETKSSPMPLTPSVTPVSYTSGYPNYQFSTGHYVTLKPSTNYVHSSTVSIQSTSESVSLPQYTQTSKPAYVNNKYTSSPNSIPEEDRITTTSYVSSSKPSSYYPSSWSTNRPTISSSYDGFNKYSTLHNEVSEEDRITTMSYVSTTTSTRRPPTTTTRKPPSTSYVFGSKPSKRPISASSNLASYDVVPDTFSSVTPTVIVLSGFTPKPEQETQQDLGTEEISEGESGFVEISQEPFKKPVNQLTINNIISSTHNIHLGSSAERPGYTQDRPSSPTVVITPKPTPSPNENRRPTKPSLTTPIIHTSTGFNVKPSTSVGPTRYTTAIPTTFRPELQTSPDDLINFPPVRNPMLNASGSNPGLYNTSISIGGDDLILHEVEFTTPSFLQEDEVLNDKMNLFVNKIVGSLQGTFQELHDIVILDKKPNVTITKPDSKVTTSKPVRKPAVTTKKPTTKRPPVRATTTTKKPTKKPIRVTSTRKPVTTTQAPTTTKKAVTTTKKPRPTKRATTTAAPTTTEQYEEPTTEETSSTPIDYSNKQLCGVRPLVKAGRIVGGKGATFGEFPWQVLVRESTWLGLFTKNKCGGVLITSRFVTTAAHCQPGFLASLVAVFGEHDISGDLEAKRPVSRNVRRVIVHRHYDAATFENDLALLELESPIHFDAHIVPICMPPDEADFTGRMATVTGWGRLKYGGGVPAVLQEVQVPVIENSVCQEMFQTAGHTKVILSSFLCAGYANGQKDSCEGDSGGPLVLQRPDGRWQLVGTVSHGIKCASPYLPGVYMRTTFYKPWLKSITGVL